MKFLQDIAETFGVEIREVFGYGETRISFAHRGLTFELHKGGVIIRIPEINKQINICVVDEKRLPLGDFYASMLGLIISRPEELDVVNFGINLGLIMLTYSGYHWNRIPSQIGIFTPFEARNSENEDFMTMLEMLGDDDHDLAPDVLEEIEGALQDCFGSTRRFL